MSRRIIALLATSLFVQGCAEANSIYRVSKLSGSDPVVIASDAKQRFLLSQIEKVPDNDRPAFRRFCIEPSPDVFTVLSQSASGSGSLGLDTNSKSLNAAIQAALSNSETGTTIPRTQTLNMLREMMYRTCERYLSGAIGEIELPIVAIRDQRVMVSILAIEQLTGAVTPKPVIISSGGSASTGQNAAEILKLVAKARDDLVTAEAGLKEAQTKMDEADTAAGAGKCTAVIAATTPDTAKVKSCKESMKALDEATATRDDADKYYKAQAKIANASQGVSNATSTPGPATDPKDWTLAQASAVKDVAATVQHIVDSTFDQDETQFFCFKQIGDAKLAKVTKDAEALAGVSAGESVQAKCLEYIIKRVEQASAIQGMRTKSILSGIGFSEAEVGETISRNQTVSTLRVAKAQRIRQCVNTPKSLSAFLALMNDKANLKPIKDKFAKAVKTGLTQTVAFLRNLLPLQRDELDDVIETQC